MTKAQSYSLVSSAPQKRKKDSKPPFSWDSIAALTTENYITKGKSFSAKQTKSPPKAISIVCLLNAIMNKVKYRSISKKAQVFPNRSKE